MNDDDEDEEQELTDKTEIFHLGMIFNFILTNEEYPYISSYSTNKYGEYDGKWHMLDQGDTSREYKRGNNVWALVKDMIIEGTLPTLPKEILDSSNPAIRALVEAREKSLEYNPSDRLSAKEITTILEKGVLDEKKSHHHRHQQQL